MEGPVVTVVHPLLGYSFPWIKKKTTLSARKTYCLKPPCVRDDMATLLSPPHHEIDNTVTLQLSINPTVDAVT